MKSMFCLFTASFFLLFITSVAQSNSSNDLDQELLLQLKKMVEIQQKQLDQQAAEIAELKKQLSGTVSPQSDKTADGTDKDVDKATTSSFSDVNLSLYGHINRAILYGDNGNSEDWYFVDNMNSQTRLGLRAAVGTGGGWKVGGRIEYGIVSNGSSDVNQFAQNNATTTNFKLRWADISLKNSRFGKLSLGKGSTATDGIAEVDLSGTSVTAYASISDTAGSLLWYDTSTGKVTDLKIKDVFSDYDGLGRTDRLRYDTPSMGGFAIAVSTASEEAFDGALRYSRKFGETAFAAAFGAAKPGNIIENVDMLYSGSASILLPFGLNATFSTAYVDLIEADRDRPTNWYAKLGYKTKFNEAATTAFSVDFGETHNVDANGDRATTWSIAGVHDMTEWATELYMVYRNHKLDRDFADFDIIHAFMVGARLKF